LLDEGFFMYAEDVDWCYRMRQAGWSVVYFPEVEVLHHYEKSAGKVPFRMAKERHKSMWRFYKKHYSNGNLLKDAVTAAAITVRLVMVMGQSSCRRRAKKSP